MIPSYRILFLSLLFIFFPGNKIFSNAIFDFENSLRIDFVLAGSSGEINGYVAELSKFTGCNYNSNTVISPFEYGTYRALMLDVNSKDTIFKKSFSALFEEWQAFEEAKTKKRAFEQTVIFPMPLSNVQVIIESRDEKGVFKPIIEEVINPKSHSIIYKKKNEYDYRLFNNDSNDESMNLLFIAEGYTEDEIELFFSEVEEVAMSLFKFEPYKKHKNKVKIHAIAPISENSGTTNPLKNEWKSTVANSSFNTFGVDRYLESLSCWRIYDMATSYPNDHIIVFVNSSDYGGGGVYNHFSITTSRNYYSDLVLVHEIGHGFAGLADEYDNEEELDSFTNRNIEPSQPNITTLVDFGSKWKEKVEEETPIPTPNKSVYRNKTGVFEGAGYTKKGVYRPAHTCIMRELSTTKFCEVCEKAIEEQILFFSKSH